MIGLSGMENLPLEYSMALPLDGMALPLYEVFMAMFLSGL
jgi:hypothetical protein